MQCFFAHSSLQPPPEDMSFNKLQSLPKSITQAQVLEELLVNNNRRRVYRRFKANGTGTPTCLLDGDP